jgi:hypothetical protein
VAPEHTIVDRYCHAGGVAVSRTLRFLWTRGVVSSAAGGRLQSMVDGISKIRYHYSNLAIPNMI